ncbi:hypothetical protein BX616_002684 [Lobosporangium transversale]|uniref:protein-serine/threonine phosphatase n=1 Tax=Lobosporangium transversale TaxID=64571 RepID=A0A1Y2H316_9FUNG|nr:hypothetical protein BCR41DRAFT_418038 [Lobosporangium transversale]KAF9900131.1 hypothetical protein BX616_002684 [Lobosporangium transversale]ORZ28947.1 hypothetical protein BCR41DRAFT_418038 [Lobosporangium transversale]|eukprot:XP_021886620.1 hypothetical protein BCR41DRAFT_418038 [Lobosporangium transversale]
MTVPESNKPVTTVAVIPTANSIKAHSFVRQYPVTSTSFQASQEGNGRGEHNGRVSIQPTGFEGGLLVGLYDPHHGPQCAEYLQQHLVPILDESLSTQLDHSDDDRDHRHANPNTCKIDPIQVIDTLKSTFKELDELLLATAITVSLAQPDGTEMNAEDEVKKTQEVIAQVITGSTALVTFLAPHTSSPSSSETGVDLRRHDLYLAQLGDSVAILAGYDAAGQWTARRLNPPETHEHSVRYPGSEEYYKVTSEAKERALTAEQFLTQHNGSSTSCTTDSTNGSNSDSSSTESAQNTFLTRHGKFLGLPVTRAFGDLDWKVEQEARSSVAPWVEKSLRAKIDQTLRSGQEQNGEPRAERSSQQDQDEIGINNLNDPPYISADPKITRFILETRNGSIPANAARGPSDQLLILLSRGLLYTTHTLTNIATADGSVQDASTATGLGKANTNPNDQALISDFELSRIAANVLEKGEENCALELAKVLDQARKDLGIMEKEGEEGDEGSVVIVVL